MDTTISNPETLCQELIDDGYMADGSMSYSDYSSDDSFYDLSSLTMPTTQHTEPTTAILRSKQSSSHGDHQGSPKRTKVIAGGLCSNVDWSPHKPETPITWKSSRDINPHTEDWRHPSLLQSQASHDSLQNVQRASSTDHSAKVLKTNGQRNLTDRTVDLVHVFRFRKGGGEPDSHDNRPEQVKNHEHKDSQLDRDESRFSSRHRRDSWSSGSTRFEQVPSLVFDGDRVSLASNVTANTNYNSDIGANPSITDPTMEQPPELNVERADHGVSLSPLRYTNSGSRLRSIRIQEPDMGRARSVRLCRPCTVSSLELNITLQENFSDDDEKRQRQKKRMSRGFHKARQGCIDALVSFFERCGLICYSLRSICCRRL